MVQNRKRLVFFERFFDPIAETILGEADDIELTKLHYASPKPENWAVLERTHGYQLSARTELDPEFEGLERLIARCPDLLAMCSTGAGYDVIDVEACTKAGIIVCNQSGTNFEPVAEHAIGMVLNLSKKIGLTNRALLRGDANNRYAMMGNNVEHKTLGIVGLGKIGTRHAHFAKAFDMNVIAYDPYLTAEQIAARGARKVEFDELLAQADYVTVHCLRSKETIGMFNAAAFAKMKPSAYFINTARGLIHREDDLLAALKSGQIAGAGIDVFDVEPPPADHPLLHMENVIATPHTAGGTFETATHMSAETARQWITLLRGQVPPRLVNPEAWPKYSDRFEKILGTRPDPLP
jgi:D-3-phosphoglycerate dehydrogenase